MADFGTVAVRPGMATSTKVNIGIFVVEALAIAIGVAMSRLADDEGVLQKQRGRNLMIGGIIAAVVHLLIVVLMNVDDPVALLTFGMLSN